MKWKVAQSAETVDVGKARIFRFSRASLIFLIMAGQGPLVYNLAKHFFTLIVAFNAGKAHAAPSIEITNVPAYGSFDNLGGRVLEASPAAYRVAVFIYVPNAGWYSKPYCDPQLTTIQPDGSWVADI